MPNVKSSHLTDDDGNPVGGMTYGQGFAISWQVGPLSKQIAPNGACVEDIIWAAVDRLEYYQHTKLVNDYNARAIGCLKAGLEALQQRTMNREKRGVEGTYNP